VLTLLRVGGTPVALALKPDGGELFVSNYEAQSISIINTSADEVEETILAGELPVRSLVAGDNATLFVSNFRANAVAVFDITTRRLLVSVAAGDGPDALALSPSESMLLVANSRSGDVAVIRLDKRKDKKITAPPQRLFTMIPVGGNPVQIVVKAPKF